MQDYLQRRNLDMFTIFNSSAAYDLNHGTRHQESLKDESSKGKELEFAELLNNQLEEIAVRI